MEYGSVLSMDGIGMLDLIKRADAVRVVLEKPDMTADEKSAVICRIASVPAVDIIPHVCDCCIGCEIEGESGDGCEHSFVPSLDRAKEYIKRMAVRARKARWVLEEKWDNWGGGVFQKWYCPCCGFVKNHGLTEDGKRISKPKSLFCEMCGAEIEREAEE